MYFVCDTETGGLDPAIYSILSVGGFLVDEIGRAHV